jgi:hypothetical protein
LKKLANDGFGQSASFRFPKWQNKVSQSVSPFPESLTASIINPFDSRSFVFEPPTASLAGSPTTLRIRRDRHYSRLLTHQQVNGACLAMRRLCPSSGFPCLVNAKADAQVCCVEPELPRSRLPSRFLETLNSNAFRLVQSAPGAGPRSLRRAAPEPPRARAWSCRRRRYRRHQYHIARTASFPNLEIYDNNGYSDRKNLSVSEILNDWSLADLLLFGGVFTALAGATAIFLAESWFQKMRQRREHFKIWQDRQLKIWQEHQRESFLRLGRDQQGFDDKNEDNSQKNRPSLLHERVNDFRRKGIGDRTADDALRVLKGSPGNRIAACPDATAKSISRPNLTPRSFSG